MTSTYLKHICRLLGAVIVIAILLASSQASAEEKGGIITVTNTSSNKIWVTVTSQKTNVTESDVLNVTEDSSSTSVAAKNAASIDVAGIGGISNEQSLSVDHSESHKKTGKVLQKINWSPFIEAGEAILLKGQKEEFKVNDSTYYLTVRRTKDTYWKLNVSKDTKTANNLTIDDNGYFDPIGEIIEAGDNVTLSFKGNDYSLTKPVDSHGWNNIANGGRTAVTHIIETVDKKSGPILTEDDILIKIVKPKYEGYNYLLHGIDNNLFYSNEPKNKASHWQVRMLNSDQELVLRSGSEVEIQGIKFDGFMTLVDGGDLQWAKALSPGAAKKTIWTIDKVVRPEPLNK